MIRFQEGMLFFSPSKCATSTVQNLHEKYLTIILTYDLVTLAQTETTTSFWYQGRVKELRECKVPCLFVKDEGGGKGMLVNGRRILRSIP